MNELSDKINSFLNESLELNINDEISKLEKFFSDFDDLNSLLMLLSTVDAGSKKVEAIVNAILYRGYKSDRYVTDYYKSLLEYGFILYDSCVKLYY